MIVGTEIENSPEPSVYPEGHSLWFETIEGHHSGKNRYNRRKSVMGYESPRISLEFPEHPKLKIQLFRT